MTKQNKIEELIPKMKPGYVACDKDGVWYYYTTKPFMNEYMEMWEVDPNYITDETEVEVLSTIFNITPAKDWKNSLIKVGK